MGARMFELGTRTFDLEQRAPLPHEMSFAAASCLKTRALLARWLRPAAAVLATIAAPSRRNAKCMFDSVRPGAAGNRRARRTKTRSYTGGVLDDGHVAGGSLIFAWVDYS
jgi:hypothetical protein